MTLPSTSPSQQDPSSTKEPPAVAKKGRVLIVDNDPDITKSFGLALEDSRLFEKVELCNDPMLWLKRKPNGVACLVQSEYLLPLK